jgi:predicted deacylase
MAQHHPIEIEPPDITPFRQGNTGVDYVHVFDSGRPGPRVMLQALTHGNEFCGAIALVHMLRKGLRPLLGSLTVAFANVAAFERFDFNAPDRSRYVDEDYNRVWSDDVLLSARDSIELRRARELARFVDQADFLLDIHSMHEPCRPIMVCGQVEKGVQFAREIGVPADLLVDTGHPGGLRMIERGGFGDPASLRKAALIECGQHWEKNAVDVAVDTLLRFAQVTGAFDETWIQARLRRPAPARQRVVRVTEAVVARTMQFHFAEQWRGLEVVPAAGTPIAYDQDTIWRAPYDNTVLVMPSLAHLKPGTTMVRLGRYD